MPSLFTHLLIAEDARKKLASPFWTSLLARHEHAYYQGCLAPDLAYFDIFHSYRGLNLGTFLSPLSHTMEERVMAWLGWSLPRQEGWAHRLHSVGTLQILKRWAAHAQGRHPALLAFIAGMATHFAADEVLHPKINADSGDPESTKGMQAHRTLEINLDFILLRARGYALEGFSQGGLMEQYLGRPQRQGDFLSPGQKAAWTETSRACDSDPITRPELERWSHGFSGAMRWLDHRFSPVEQQRRLFVSGSEEKWRTFFARERYLSSHVPRATATAAQWMERVLLESAATGSRRR